MTAHKHAEMIKAKADNVELITFVRSGVSDWIVSGQHPNFHPNNEYFLCLPQHNENGQCLHWLNGGEVQLQDFPTIPFIDYSDQPSSWSPELWWMSEQCNIRIKPKKEKLWLAVKTDKHENLGGCRKVRICSHAFVNKSDAEDYLDLTDSQLVEIEIEV